MLSCFYLFSGPLNLSAPPALVAEVDKHYQLPCHGFGYPEFTIKWTVSSGTSTSERAQERLVGQGTNANLLYVGNSTLNFRGSDLVSGYGLTVTAVCTATYINFNCTKTLMTSKDYSRCQNIPRTIKRSTTITVLGKLLAVGNIIVTCTAVMAYSESVFWSYAEANLAAFIFGARISLPWTPFKTLNHPMKVCE